MKELKAIPLAFTYAGCFLGAGYVSGQELWQFFGSFGNWGYVGFVIAIGLFVMLGIMLIRLTQMTGCEAVDRLLVPWDIPWLRTAAGLIMAGMLLCTTVIMTAGVAALLHQLFAVPAWLGGLAFAAAVVLITLLGISGMIRTFAMLIPLLVGATILFAVIAFCQFDLHNIFRLTNTNTNPLTPNWLIAALTFVSYNFLGGIGIMTPVGKLVKQEKTVYAGMILSGLLLTGVAFSVLGSLAIFPPATEAELPMVALASQLNPILGGCYGLMMLIAMFCNSLGSLVALTTYMEQKKPNLMKKKKTVCLASGVFIWAGSLIGFGDLVGTVFPFFGYISVVYMVGLTVHFVREKKKGNEKIPEA